MPRSSHSGCHTPARMLLHTHLRGKVPPLQARLELVSALHTLQRAACRRCARASRTSEAQCLRRGLPDWCDHHVAHKISKPARTNNPHHHDNSKIVRNSARAPAHRSRTSRHMRRATASRAANSGMAVGLHSHTSTLPVAECTHRSISSSNSSSSSSSSALPRTWTLLLHRPTCAQRARATPLPRRVSSPTRRQTTPHPAPSTNRTRWSWKTALQWHQLQLPHRHSTVTLL